MSEEYNELTRLWTAAIACEENSSTSTETLHQLYEARMKKFTWVGSDEHHLRHSLDLYLENRGYSSPITTEIRQAD